jgi:xylose isomerase
LKKKRYESFDKGKGKDFEKGKLSLDKIRTIAKETGEPARLSGKQELLEQLINMYIV